MEIGERIKRFRLIRGLTQKMLGVATGIGESTIRKYELGIRNPKPAQIKKIASALGVDENVFHNIPLNTLQIQTVGDAMTLYFILEDCLGISFTGEKGKDGTFDPNNLTFKFDNPTFNKHLVDWLATKYKPNSIIDDKTVSEKNRKDSSTLHNMSCEVTKAILIRKEEKL